MCVSRFVVCEYWPPGNVVSRQENLYLKNVGRPGQPFKEPSKDANTKVPPYKGNDIKLPDSLANDRSDGSTSGAAGGGNASNSKHNHDHKTKEQKPSQSLSLSPSPSLHPSNQTQSQGTSQAAKGVTATVTRKRESILPSA